MVTPSSKEHALLPLKTVMYLKNLDISYLRAWSFDYVYMLKWDLFWSCI